MGKEVKEVFRVCPNCGSTDIGLTSEDGVCICRSCSYHACYYHKNVFCFMNDNKGTCHTFCLRAYLSPKDFKEVVKKYEIPDWGYGGQKK